RMSVVDAAIDYSNSNSASVEASGPGRGCTCNHICSVIQALHRVVDAHGKNFGIGFQGWQGAHRNREGDTFDHAKAVVQASAKMLHSTFLRRLWNLFVLHDHLYSLISGRALMSSLNLGREVCANRTSNSVPRRFPQAAL